MTEEQFEENKKALATLLSVKLGNLTARCDLYWNEIETQQYNFDRVNIEVAYLKTISRQQLLNFFKVINLLLYYIQNYHLILFHKKNVLLYK